MPIQSTYNEIVRTKMTGVVTYAELMDHVKYLANLEIEGRIFIELTDQTEADLIDISGEQARMLAEMAQRIHRKYDSVHNILLSGKAVTFGVSRMQGTYISNASEKPIWHFFSTRGEAENQARRLLEGANQ